MISTIDLEQTARSYLRAARLLNRKSHPTPDASIYLCGYAVEIALKTRICRTLGWAGYPAVKKEFEGYTSFQTHNLTNLLHLSGVESRITADPILRIEWSVVARWNPEQRYNPPGTRTASDAASMIEAASKILMVIL